MRNLNRKSKAIGIITAAAGLAASVQFASAQVWNNPNTGNWSTGSNWVGGLPPAPGVTTQLTFNAVGAQTYTATNDIANPFLLNAINFGNNGTGQINIAGSALSFGGTSAAINQNGSGVANVSNAISIVSAADQTPLTIGGTGAGVLNLSGALSSSPASTGTAGGYLLMNDPNSTLNLSGGGTLYSLVTGRGTTNVTGGTWVMTSTERGNDVVGPVNDGGIWGFSVGRTSGAIARYNQTGGTINASVGGFVGDEPGSIGIATISGASTVLNVANGRFGVNWGTGTILISGGAKSNTRLIEVGRQTGSSADITVSGTGSELNGLAGGTAGQLLLARAGVVYSKFTLSNGATSLIAAAPTIANTPGVSSPNGQIIVAAAENTTATLNVLSGGSLGVQGNMFSSVNTGPLGDPVDSTAVVTIDGANSRLNVGSFQQNNGTTAFTGGQQTFATTGHGTFTVSNGGATTSETIFTASTPPGLATINLSGGTMSVNNVAVLSGGGAAGAGVTHLAVTNGGRLQGNRFTFGQNAGGVMDIVVSGANSKITTAFGAGTGSWAVASGDNTSVATISVSNGAVVEAPQGALFMSGGITNNGGGTTVFNLGAATANFGFTQISNSIGSTGTFNVNAGGVLNSGTSTLLGLAETTTSALNVNGAGAVVNTPVLSVGFGGQTALGDPLPGGTNFLNVTGGGQINTTGLGVSIADSIDTFATAVVSGANSKITSTGTAQLVVGSDSGAVGTLNISNGGAVNMAGNAFISAGTTSIATVNVNAGTLAMGGNLLLAINGGNDTGTATLTATNGGVITSTATVVASQATLTVGTGTSAARHSATGDVIVNGTVNYNAGTFTAGGTLGVGGNVLLSSANRNAAGTPSNKKLLEVGQATLTTTGVIDLNDNDMLAHDSNKAKYEQFVKTARNGNLWNQPGITSTAAKNSVPKNKNLGILSGAEYHTAQGAGATFNGKAVLNTDTLIKFTFNGDTDLNGVVNFDDYARIDGGFNNGRTGWFNGDFDYSGAVDFDDYSLIDQAFNTQGTVVLSAAGGLAGPGDRTIVPISQNGASMVGTDGSLMLRPTHGMDYAVGRQGDGGVGGGNLQAVPEPATLSIVGLGMLGAMRRRRRHA